MEAGRKLDDRAAVEGDTSGAKIGRSANVDD
jgi:hypothetical protein